MRKTKNKIYKTLLLHNMNYKELLEQNRPCPFCDLTLNETILENETAFLTYALAPYHVDHLLVCTKRHVEHILNLSSEEVCDIDDLQKRGFTALANMGYKNVSLLVRDGDNIGKSVKHIHYHLIPEVSLGAQDHAGADRPVLSKEECDLLVKRFNEVIAN